MLQSTPATATTTRAPQSFLACLGQFLTPQVWKQAHLTAPRRRALRWQRHPLILVLLVMTWCAGDALPERFEAARAFYVALHQRRRRPGRTVVGFEKALGHLPLAVLRAVAAAVRGRLAQVFAQRFWVDGFIPLGCDGSRLACPRSQELERRLGLGKKPKKKKRPKKAASSGATVAEAQGSACREGITTRAASTPQLWVTAVVHLGLGVLWSWRLGTGHANEREHLRRLVGTLPRGALLVADAGYVGYELMAALQAAGQVYLLRLSAWAPLYVPDKSTLGKYREGLVYYWPKKAQQHDRPPLLVRLWRIRGDKKGDVWLLTNVLDESRLPRRTAGKFYRWRWRNEGLFRTYKRTLGKVKLMSRTVVQVHREAFGSLLATQLLLAQGALALPAAAAKVVLPSARKVLLEIRVEIRNVTGMYLGPRQAASYMDRLAQARWPQRRQRPSKVRHRWPGRQDHKPPGPPKILKMGTILKDKMAKTLASAQACNC